MSSELTQADFIGVWRRESLSIKGQEPFENENVFWLHAGKHFADIRWSIETGEITSAFAGVASWNAPEMKFQHDVDSSRVGSEDVGVLSFRDGKLIEQGEAVLENDIIPFEEIWLPVAGATGDDCSVDFLRDDKTHRYVVRVGAYAIGMRREGDVFSAGFWQFLEGVWNLEFSFGDVSWRGSFDA